MKKSINALALITCLAAIALFFQIGCAGEEVVEAPADMEQEVGNNEAEEPVEDPGKEE
tara:strand:+ start:116 stop:289 length:174 start_codon:yes stop_codon:yes gene_type:complete